MHTVAVRSKRNIDTIIDKQGHATGSRDIAAEAARGSHEIGGVGVLVAQLDDADAARDGVRDQGRQAARRVPRAQHRRRAVRY